MRNENYAKKDVNDGKVTSEQSSHPIGTAVGTVAGMAAGVSGAYLAGAATGAAAGNVLGPVGAAAGAIIGGMVGAGAGHEIAAQINPKAEDDFWRNNYSSRPYVASGTEYEVYRPAFKFGVESFVEHKGRSFDEIEPDLGRNWKSRKEGSTLEWNEARHAARDSYNRLYGADDSEE